MPAEFIAGFIAEAEEHLASANANLLSIEQAAAKGQPTPREVRELFRSLHTIKGLAAMVGVEPIVDIAHAHGGGAARGRSRCGTAARAASVELLLTACAPSSSASTRWPSGRPSAPRRPVCSPR